MASRPVLHPHCSKPRMLLLEQWAAQVNLCSFVHCDLLRNTPSASLSTRPRWLISNAEAGRGKKSPLRRELSASSTLQYVQALLYFSLSCTVKAPESCQKSVLAKVCLQQAAVQARCWAGSPAAVFHWGNWDMMGRVSVDQAVSSSGLLPPCRDSHVHLIPPWLLPSPRCCPCFILLKSVSL